MANLTLDLNIAGLFNDRGAFNASSNVFPSTGGSGAAGAILRGDTWTITMAGILGGTAVAPGDMVRAMADAPTAADWNINLASGGGGAGNVTGPASSTDNAITRYDGATGKLIQNSLATVDDAGNVSATNIAGTNTGDQTIILTGDVTGGGTSAFSTTIANNAVTNTKAAQMPASTIKGNNAGAVADPADLTVAQTKVMLALEQVNNTSDANKPVSTAQSAALALKAPLASPAFTGTPTAPTAAPGDNSTQVSTTAYTDTALSLKADDRVTINTQSGTAYTVVLSDGGQSKLLRQTNAAATTCTIPPNSSVAFPVGTVLNGEQAGDGVVMLTPGAGVTLNSRAAALKTAGKYAFWSMVKVGTDEWEVTGDMVP